MRKCRLGILCGTRRGYLCLWFHCRYVFGLLEWVGPLRLTTTIMQASSGDVSVIDGVAGR